MTRDELDRIKDPNELLRVLARQQAIQNDRIEVLSRKLGDSLFVTVRNAVGWGMVWFVVIMIFFQVAVWAVAAILFSMFGGAEAFARTFRIVSPAPIEVKP